MTSGAEQTRRGLACQFVKRLLAVGVAASLTGCVEALGDLDASAPAQAQAESQPQTQATAASPFIQKLAAETRSREINSVQPDVAKYIVHGYLSATRNSGGAVIGYVWDVFDSHQRRIQRIEDQVMAPGAAADPWSLANDRVLSNLAAKSATGLAILLSQTPEALKEGALATSDTQAQQVRASLAGTSALR
jgi:hypothetical protein